MVKDPEDHGATIDASEIDGEHRVHATDLIPGQTFAGRYEVVSLVGRGGMGTVWKVRDRMVGETVALKTLHVSHDNERAIERFRREVRLARRITSPHVARTHDLGTQAGLHYLTMELVDGASLARVLEQEGTLLPERAARVAAQIAEGLAAAHAAGVVHRDLKPDNVIVERVQHEGRPARVVVTDFGIARALQDSADAAKTGGIVGTPLYMAPEQIAGSSVDARADLYALGLVLYEMLTGRAAFEADTPIAAAVKRLHQAPPDPREIAAHVPEGLAQIVLRCLARDPSARFPDASALARALLALAGTGSLSIDLAGAVMQGLGGQGLPGLTSPSTPSTPSGASRSPVAPLLKHDRSLAVLPFAYRGPSDQDWLAAGIRDELIDVLSRTRGLRVLGRGAVESIDAGHDPRAIGRELGFDLAVDGSVQVGGTRLRVTARLVEVATGTQLWSERFDAEIEDLFVVQERVGHRIAEALRLGMHAVAGAVPLPPGTLELYLRARRTARGGNIGDSAQVADMLERVIEAAPDFQPAYAAHAMASVRAWFVPRTATSRDWKSIAEQSVARAMERAPDLAESHFACAHFHSQEGHYREAVQSARTALGIAPTLPEAHMFLASLQLEAGRAKEGLQRLELALGLEPTLPLAIIEKSRWHGLYGDLEVFESIMRLWEQDPAHDWMRANQLIRVGAFRNDPDKIARGIALMSRLDNPAGPFLILYGRTMLGELDAKTGVDPVLQVLNGPVSGRFRSLIHQMASEAWGRAGDVEKTLEHFRKGAETVLLDLEWVDRCPMLEIIRPHPEFPDLRRKVRARCEQIWTA